MQEDEEEKEGTTVPETGDEGKNEGEMDDLLPPAVYMDFNTGAVGVAATVVAVIYGALLIFYFIWPFLNAEANIRSTLYKVFLVWSTFKPVILFMMATYSALNVTNAGLTFLLLVLIGIIAVGSLGMIAFAVALLPQCNTVAGGANAACNDLLYCCVYFASVPECAGLGPCPPPNPQVPSDLSLNTDFLIMLITIAVLFVSEIVMAILVYFVRQARARRERTAIHLQAKHQRQVKVMPPPATAPVIGSFYPAPSPTALLFATPGVSTPPPAPIKSSGGAGRFVSSMDRFRRSAAPLHAVTSPYPAQQQHHAPPIPSASSAAAAGSPVRSGRVYPPTLLDRFASAQDWVNRRIDWAGIEYHFDRLLHGDFHRPAHLSTLKPKIE